MGLALNNVKLKETSLPFLEGAYFFVLRLLASSEDEVCLRSVSLKTGLLNH